MAGSPARGPLVGDMLAQITKNSMKIAKTMFFGQNSEDRGGGVGRGGHVNLSGEKVLFLSGGEDLSQSSILGETLTEKQSLAIK